MQKYILTMTVIGLPTPQEFRESSDSNAVSYSTGFVTGLIGRNPDEYVGAQLQLHEDRGDRFFNDSTRVANGLVDDRDGLIGPQWEVTRRRWLHERGDMNVGDPHDGATGGPSRSPIDDH